MYYFKGEVDYVSSIKESKDIIKEQRCMNNGLL